MITKNDLEVQYSEYSISALLEIIENRHNYTDLAFVVAIEEISKRNITEKEIADHKQNEIETISKLLKKNYVDRLNIGQKHFFFFIWVPFFTAPYKRDFRQTGCEMKLRQARYFSFMGCASLFLSNYLSLNFNLGKGSFWVILILTFGLTLTFDGVFNSVTSFDNNPEQQNDERS